MITKHSLITSVNSINLIISLIVVIILLCCPTMSFALDAQQDGPVYGDPEGLARVAKLEEQLHNMRIRQDHPRILLTKDNVDKYRQRVQAGHPAWQGIKSKADNGDMVNAAFVYQMTEDEGYARVAIEEAVNAPCDSKEDAALISLVFDWCYDVMSDEERDALVTKIAQAADLDAEIPDHRFANTFHSEEWSFRSWQAFPEVALAHHHPKAEEWYKARWSYDWVWGDGARFIAYTRDGNRHEAYFHYGPQLMWFLVLRSATGINLIDAPEFPYFQQAGYLYFYKTDFGTKRVVFYKGYVGYDSASIISYTYWWQHRAEFGVTGAMTENPYVYWGMEKVNAGGLNDPYGIRTLGDIWNFIIYNKNISKKDPHTASWDELPLSKLFPGSKKAIMRSSWDNDAIIIGFRNLERKVQWHSPADANTFYIYRKGLLSGNTGERDAGASDHTGNWQCSTIAHNNLLVFDPDNPTFPSKNDVDQGDVWSNGGGTETQSSMVFGMPYRRAFLHIPKCQQQGGIPAFEASPEYTYLVGQATEAYRSRLNEFDRSLVFIPKEGNKGYLIVFDRVEAKKPEYIKKWLMHFVSKPQINGNKVSEEVPGNIETFDGDLISSTNVKNTSSLHIKTLLPSEHLIRRVGSEAYGGYEFWRDDLQRNVGVREGHLERAVNTMGGPEVSDINEVGFWRIELIPKNPATRDYFLNVIYIGDANESFDPNSIQIIEDPRGYIKFSINDPETIFYITFNKIDLPGGHIKIVKDGQVVVDKDFDPPQLSITKIITPSLPDGAIDTDYTTQLTAAGGTEPYSWSLDSGTLPDGLYLSSDGVISGIPIAEGVYTFSIKVTDSSDPLQEDIKEFTVTIERPISYKISGGAYFYPEGGRYRASFSLDVDSGSLASSWLKYYYTRTRMYVVSTEISDVSVSDNRATITGSCTVNGVAGYTFSATIVDNTPDAFGITIYKDGTVYYTIDLTNMTGGDLTVSILE